MWEALGGFAGGVDFEEFFCVGEDGAFGLLAGFVPAAVAEGAEVRGFFAETDVAADEVGLGEGDVEPGVVGVFDDDDIFFRAIGVGAPDETAVAADAVLLVNDEFAVGDAGEVEGDFALTLAALSGDEAAGAGVLVAAEDFCVAEDGEGSGGCGEAAGDAADGEFEVGVFDAFGGEEFAEAFDFAFVIEEHDDAPVVGVPAAELVGEGLAARFEHDEVAGVEGACGFGVAGGAEVFGGFGGEWADAFGDPDIGAGAGFEVSGDDEVSGVDAVGEETGCGVGAGG